MREFLRSKGFRMTPQREVVFRAFFSAKQHLSLEQLYQQVLSIDDSIGYATVWRNLKLICEVGLAEEFNVGDGVTRYAPISPRRPLAHFYCVECKYFVDIDAAELMPAVRKHIDRDGLIPHQIKIEIQGRCKECLKLRDKNRPTRRISSVESRLERS